MQDNRPLEDQFPADGASRDDILVWAIKAKKRIKRDKTTVSKLRYKLQKRKTQMRNAEIAMIRYRADIKKLRGELERRSKSIVYSLKRVFVRWDEVDG
jgi:septal ring factor EnvC (AmiA/AmiB activator)